MGGSIVTLLVIGVAACAGTHRNRFRPAPRARQQPTVAVGPASPAGTNEQKCCRVPVFRSAVPASPARAQEHFDRREPEGVSQTEAKEHAND
jgi:hypothetical protein